jgi:signal transduction histidine kinase
MHSFPLAALKAARATGLWRYSARRPVDTSQYRGASNAPVVAPRGVHNGWRTPAPWRGLAADNDLRAHNLSIDQAAVPALGRYVALWLVLALVTVIIVVVPNLPVATYQPHLSSAVGAVSGAIGLALLQLGVLRFRLLRRSLDLHTGLGFGVLALGNLFAIWASAPTDNGDLPLEVSLYVMLLTRATAAILFLTGLAWTHSGLTASRSAQSILLKPLAVAALMVGIGLAMLVQFPILLDATATDVLNSGHSISDFLPGQAPALIAANATIAAALCIAAIGYTLAARRLLDPYISMLAAGLTLLFFSQLQAILFPSMASDYVATGDVFRLVAYGLLVSNLVWRTAADVADRTVRSERLRMSRELHDGLAQQLALLRLRLGRASELAGTSDELAHDLEVAERLVEAAALDARQAIAVLRADHVSWETLDQALTTFADEFSQNHDVDVRVSTEPATGAVSIDGILQAELLRILHEACSNAVRHGRATLIHAHLSVVRRVLRLAISDDGRGFDATQASRGLGLRSIAERIERRGGQLLVDAAEGKGTSIRVSLPLGARASY